MIRYGIVGFGLHAVRRLMPGFVGAKQCTVTALWRRDREKAQQSVRKYTNFPIRAYDSPESLCSSPDVDAVFVASPDALHLGHVLLALKHGKHVLCEKPMAMNVAECERMISAAEKAGVMLGIAQNFRFNSSVNRMRELIAQGKIGKPLVARSEFYYSTLNSPRAWINDPNLACGGPVGDVAVHCIDSLRYILQDEVVSVYARALSDEHSGAVECAAALLLEFQKGTIANITVSTRAEYRSPLWITGDGGLLGAEDALNVEHPLKLILKPIDGEQSVEEMSNEAAYTEQVDAFALSIERGATFLCPGVEGLKNQRVLDAAYRSIRTGNREALEN